MATPAEVARAYQARQRSIIMAVLAAVLGLWRRIDRDRLTQSWQAGLGPAIVDTVARGQVQAAALAPAYLSELAEAQNVGVPDLEVVPEALSGVASDGRPLESLMYQPVIALKRLLADGVPIEEAVRQAAAHMTMIAATQVADAGRGATAAGMAANRQWVSYVRVVNLPACSRCIILAGRTYSFSTGFQRHPNCDCTMRPVTSEEELAEIASPRDLFDQMSEDEQNRRFGKAGAEAIRLGSDIGQVVNARRGMQTAGGRLVTTEGTTRRGAAARRLGGQARLMPEQILADAAGDRDEAVRLLVRNGYLRQAHRRRPEAPVAPPVEVPRQLAESPAPVPAAVPEPAASRVQAEDRQEAPTQVPRRAQPYHRSLDGIEHIAATVEDTPAVQRRSLTGGQSADTELVTFAGGTRLVHKTGGNPDAELAASWIARALGLRAPAVYRDSESSVWMEYVDDALTVNELEVVDPAGLEARWRASREHDDGYLIGLLDVLIGNGDRNNGNYLLTDDGRIIPIDHGHAWLQGTGLRRVRQVRANGRFAGSFIGGPNPLTQGDVEEVRRRLERLRPDFAHIGRGAWLDYSFGVLDLLQNQAEGPWSIIPPEEP